jgi:glutamyl-tRNA reductase
MNDLSNSHLVYDPSVLITGVNYRTLNLEGREGLARVAPKPELIADTLVKRGIVSEAAVLSTCNRFEIVSIGGDGGGVQAFFEELLQANLRLSNRSLDLNAALYQYRDAFAVRHLYRVSSSLDSMVLGEAQILGQVKRSYQQAVDIGSVGSHLHHLFQSAFRVAKKVRSHTEIGAHGVSLSYVAVRLAQQIFSDLSQLSVVVIGSGEMAELAVLHLCAHGCSKIVVANRTLERAAALAERFGGMAVSLADLDRVLGTADIVIGSISIDRPLITVKGVASRPKGRPLFLIDLGVPRNFSSELSKLDSVYLYNIDDLASVALENRGLREAAAKEAGVVIEYGLAQFERWRRKIALNPEVVDLRLAVSQICSDVIKGYCAKLGDEGIADDVASYIGQRINHKITEIILRQKGVLTGENDDDFCPPFLVVGGDKG